MTPINKWYEKKPLVGHCKTFRCVSWENIYDAYTKMLGAESYVCIMMGYSKESKAYQLFDPTKQQIITNRNVIFDEKYSGIKLLTSSSGLLHSDPFDIFSNNGLIVPLLSVSTSQLTSLPQLTCSQSTPAKTITSPDLPFEMNDSTLTPCLP